MMDFTAAIIGMLLLIAVIFTTYQIGKRDMRAEIKLYGCEQAMKAYEGK